MVSEKRASPKALVLWAQKGICIFFIVWVAVVAPLIYFERFSIHREIQTVQISLLRLKKPGLIRLSPALRQVGPQLHRPVLRQAAIAKFEARHLALSGILSTLTVFNDKGWLNNIWPADRLGLLRWGRLAGVLLMKRLLYLSPPEKPPPFPPALIWLCPSFLHL